MPSLLIGSLLWLLIGLLIGLLAIVARLQPAVWGWRSWVWMPGLGALVALFAGWLAVLLLGIWFATPMALWVAVVGVVVVPRLLLRRQRFICALEKHG